MLSNMVWRTPDEERSSPLQRTDDETSEAFDSDLEEHCAEMRAENEARQTAAWASLDPYVTKRLGMATTTGLEISATGREFRVVEGSASKTKIPKTYSQSGYPAVKLFSTRFYVHDLVYYAFHPEEIESCDDNSVGHIRPDKIDDNYNSISNLVCKAGAKKKKRGRSADEVGAPVAVKRTKKAGSITCPHCACTIQVVTETLAM